MVMHRNSFDLNIDPIFQSKFYHSDAKQIMEHFDVPFPIPQNLEELTNYYLAPANNETLQNKKKNFTSGVMAIIADLKAWAQQNQVPGHESLEEFKHNFDWSQNLSYMTKSLPLFKEGLPLLFKIFQLLKDNNISLEKRKKALENLFKGIEVCGPGVHTNIFTTFMELTNDPRFEIDAIKFKITQQAAAVALYYYNQLQNLILMHYSLQPIPPGNEIHYINGIINYFSGILGTALIEDEFISNDPHLHILCKGDQSLGFKGFNTIIQQSMTLENIIECLLERLNLDEIREKTLADPGTIKFVETFLLALGNDKSFNMNVLFNDMAIAYDQYYIHRDAKFYLALSILERLRESNFLSFNYQKLQLSETVYYVPNHSLYFAYVEIDKKKVPFYLYALNCLLKEDTRPLTFANQLGFENEFKNNIVSILLNQAKDLFSILQNEKPNKSDLEELNRTRLEWVQKFLNLSSSEIGRVILPPKFMGEVLASLKSLPPEAIKEAGNFFSTNIKWFVDYFKSSTPAELTLFLSFFDENQKQDFFKLFRGSILHFTINLDENTFLDFVNSLSIVPKDQVAAYYKSIMNTQQNVADKLLKTPLVLFQKLEKLSVESISHFLICVRSELYDYFINLSFPNWQKIPAKITPLLIDILFDGPDTFIKWLSDKGEKTRIYYLQYLDANNFAKLIPDTAALEALLKLFSHSKRDQMMTLEKIASNSSENQLNQYQTSKYYIELKEFKFKEIFDLLLQAFPNFTTLPAHLVLLDPKFNLLIKDPIYLLELIKKMALHERLNLFIFVNDQHSLLQDTDPKLLATIINCLEPVSVQYFVFILREIPPNKLFTMLANLKMTPILRTGLSVKNVMYALGSPMSDEFLKIFAVKLTDDELENYQDEPAIAKQLAQFKSKSSAFYSTFGLLKPSVEQQQESMQSKDDEDNEKTEPNPKFRKLGGDE